jgi:hypothetical protein
MVVMVCAVWCTVCMWSMGAVCVVCVCLWCVCVCGVCVCEWGAFGGLVMWARTLQSKAP